MRKPCSCYLAIYPCRTGKLQSPGRDGQYHPHLSGAGPTAKSPSGAGLPAHDDPQARAGWQRQACSRETSPAGHRRFSSHPSARGGPYQTVSAERPSQKR